MTSAKVICDSQGHTRLTTFEIEFPRFLQAELNTHKQLAKNSASSRAIPVEKQLERVRESPFVPSWWGQNQAGMQARDSVGQVASAHAAQIWRYAAHSAIGRAQELKNLNIHKQYANRLIELWSYQKVIITGDQASWANFFNLRCDAAAQPEFDELAGLMLQSYIDSYPVKLEVGEWHCPYTRHATQGTEDLRPVPFEGPPFYIMDGDTPVYTLDPYDDLREPFVISAARCARVSYRAGDSTLDKDRELVAKLEDGGHWSPFEHQARVSDRPMAAPWEHCEGPWKGWEQLRKFFPGENRTHLEPDTLLAGWRQRRMERGLV